MSEAKREMRECTKAWESESEAWESESVRESEVKAWESVRERGRAKSNNVISRARDKVQSLETRSESQQGSETRGEVPLVFWYVQESIYIM
jgi:hypothetical protein